MKLLVTGALRITPEESAELENLGYEIYFMPDERVAVPENIPCEEIEAIICNGLFSILRRINSRSSEPFS